MQIVFTTVGYIKLDHLSRKMCYTNCVIKIIIIIIIIIIKKTGLKMTNL